MDGSDLQESKPELHRDDVNGCINTQTLFTESSISAMTRSIVSFELKSSLSSSMVILPTCSRVTARGLTASSGLWLDSSRQAAVTVVAKIVQISKVHSFG